MGRVTRMGIHNNSIKIETTDLRFEFCVSLFAEIQDRNYTKKLSDKKPNFLDLILGREGYI